MSAGLEAEDRVLLLAIASKDELVTMARQLTRGVLVAIGSRDEVDQARESMAEYENAMFVEAAPDRIPWREAYFTKVVIPPHLDLMVRQMGPELHRVLAPGGAIVRQTVET